MAGPVQDLLITVPIIIIFFFSFSDINECAESLSNCTSEATCINTGGGYYCNCPTGYYGDGRPDPGVGCVGMLSLQYLYYLV